MTDVISIVVSVIGVVFIAIGTISYYRLENFYARALMSSKIDTVGFIIVLVGLIIRHGISVFSLKIFLLILISMVINPLVSHSIVRSAYISGYRVKRRDE